ncbi:histone deacetylase hosB [Aspergillus undulatus]|uniref:histone deacetylase hosB n=1 Tax=Aspergillus undulatus TaxID=1810928 RepID=UPI003CCD4690
MVWSLLVSLPISPPSQLSPLSLVAHLKPSLPLLLIACLLSLSSTPRKSNGIDVCTMDSSKPAAPTTETPSRRPPRPPTPIDPSIFADRLSDLSLAATPLPTSPSTLSTPSLLSPSGVPARSGASPAPQSTPRRIPSSSSLRDERRKSTPNLKKRSSTASLRSSQLGGPASPRPSMSRRSSSALATSPTASLSANGHNMSSRKSSLAVAPEQTAPKAASIAADHFKKEVDHHQSANLQSQTLVVIHDACYGHRFSRPRASRAALSSIVERPERVQACVLGISAAYVRLARRHAAGPFAPHPDLNIHQLPIPPFQIRKTARTMAINSTAVTHVHGTKWMEDLKSMCDAAESRLALNGRELVRPRSAGKDSAAGAAPASAFHEGDLYLCSESLNAFEGALGGVCEGMDAVLGPGPTKRSFVCIRPPGHHCSASHPSGFCWINNVHVGISYAAMTHGLTHAAILDFDLHHGDGSQDITWEQNQKALNSPKNAAAHKKVMIGYFSLHDINSYPCEMGEPEKVRNASVCINGAHGQSIWNVHLEPWKTEQEFWGHYSSKYTVLIEKARAFLKTHTERLASVPSGPPPKAAIFISAGFDASEWEGAGMQRHKVNVPTDFYARFTADIVRMAEEEGLGVDGRVISVLEGGYSNRALTTGVLSHLSGLGDPQSAETSDMNRLAAEMTDRLGLTDDATAPTEQPVFEPIYDPAWWSPPLLEELEALVYPEPPAVKAKEKSAPTYFAPTQSFTAKVVTPTRDRKSTGSHASLELEPPPLPPVDWAVAAHELSKVLIPSDRQVNSCRPEELNAEASRLRRERHTASGDFARDEVVTPTESVAGEENKMKLRIRKPKASLPSTPRAETPARRTNRNTRRTTLDSPSALPNQPKSPGPHAPRRKSGTSTPATTTSSTPERDLPPPRPLSQGSVTLRKPSASRSTSRSGTPRRAASPRKAPPVPRVPSAFLATTAPEEQSTASRPTTSAGSEHVVDDMDSLTADVKKLSIKLKVPSPEENAAREKKKAADERKRKPVKSVAKTSRSPRKVSTGKDSSRPTSRATSQPPAPSSPRDEPPLPDVPKETSTSTIRERMAAFEKQQGHLLATPDASSPTPAIKTREPEIAHVTEHRWDQKSAAGEHALSIQNANAGISPPLTPGPASDSVSPKSMLFATPASVSVTKHGLPGFTSSGPIPFAPSNAPKEKPEEKPE